MKIGFIRKSILQLITRIQKVLCRSEDAFKLLSFLIKLHFYIYFGKTIKSAIKENKNSKEVKQFQHRTALVLFEYATDGDICRMKGKDKEMYRALTEYTLIEYGK